MSRVLGYEAKWHEDSFAYIHTVRHFPDDPADAALLARAGDLARAAWRIFGLKGYARVDLRLDAAGEPCILEVNANPCLAADAGFMAAAGRAGLVARRTSWSASCATPWCRQAVAAPPQRSAGGAPSASPSAAASSPPTAGRSKS